MQTQIHTNIRKEKLLSYTYTSNVENNIFFKVMKCNGQLIFNIRNPNCFH